MFHDHEVITTEVDLTINAGDSFLIDDPVALNDLDQKTKGSFRIISQNIRSVHKNLDDFGVFISRTKLDFDLIFLTECWLQGSGSLPPLDYFNAYQTCKHINQNSGVIAYIRNNVADVSVYEPIVDEADCLVVRIGSDHAFICVYRSPSFSSIAKFLNSLSILLFSLETVPNVYVLGDLNIDICKNNTDNRSDEYLDLLATHGLLPSHVYPTRLIKCYDHCFVKSNTKVITAVCDSSVTDHKCIYLAISPVQPLIKRQRSFNKVNHKKAFDLLLKVNWDTILMELDPNKATELFFHTVSGVINKCTQLLTVPNRRLTLQPWITPGLLRCMRFKDKLHQRHNKSPNDKHLETTYKRYRNHCNNILHNLKHKFDQADLLDAKGDIKKTWNVIKRVCNLNNNITDQSSRHSTVSIDRVKPAYLAPDPENTSHLVTTAEETSVPPVATTAPSSFELPTPSLPPAVATNNTAQQPVTTRSGRTVRFKSRLDL
ncbi:putative tick transposon [Operophtera brumata]|uniref:Putative tick transposon n=1 Tax=Operophtera brumata TaxID=104452 RepID=A0A0L7LRY2_OPEBR|nr:putative tick transposon [Operophtera brumata]